MKNIPKSSDVRLGPRIKQLTTAINKQTINKFIYISYVKAEVPFILDNFYCRMLKYGWIFNDIYIHHIQNSVRIKLNLE